MVVTGDRNGALALVGSGEFTDQMNDTDSFLINTLGGPDKTRVAIIPTASGLEPGMPLHWAQKGTDHFQKLGATAKPAMIITREDAGESVFLNTLQNSNFFYFSGGNPMYLIDTFRDTPAWDIISQAYRDGAVLAGCSAGAMAFGSHTLNVRTIASSSSVNWLQGLNLLSNVITFPHFDRITSFTTPETIMQITTSAPAESIMLGIDEDTALVGYNSDEIMPDADSSHVWQVMGRQTVTVFDRNGHAEIFESGERFQLMVMH